LVDDDRNHLQAMWRAFKLDGRHEAEKFSSSQEALARAKDRAFDVVVCDYRMPEMDGMEFLKQFRALQPAAYRLLISGYGDLALFSTALKDDRVDHFLEKPCEGIQLLRAVDAGLERMSTGKEVRRLQQELESLRREHDELVKRVSAHAPHLLES
jgi:DNA-binding NtrC family response regulator